MAGETANTTTLRPEASVRVEMTEYDPETGWEVRKITSLNFGATPLEKMSTPMAIKMNVIGVKKVANIKLCIIESSEVVSGTGTKNSDGSSEFGNFGIEHSGSLSTKTLLTSFFSGSNPTGSPSSNNNISISNSSNTESEYVYFNAKMPNSVSRGYVIYKWIFNFS